MKHNQQPDICLQPIRNNTLHIHHNKSFEKQQYHNQAPDKPHKTSFEQKGSGWTP
jgi:hypothetical protein